MKILLSFALLFAALTLGGYLYFRSAGVEISTSVDAFAIPAVDQLVHARPDGKAELLLDITPAPWPDEARSIYRLASMGIPVRISVQDGKSKRHFVIVGVDGKDHLRVSSASKADALATLKFLGYSGQ
jgi:hypothetical protein